MNSPTSNRRSRTPLQRVAGGALASLVALGAIAIGVDAAATPATFPALSQWVVVTLGNTPVFDPEGDTPGARDIVGNTQFPMLYIASDATHIYFRLRVDSDPAKNPTDFGSFGWGCFVDTDGDPQTYEFSTIIDGVANPDRIYLYKNTVTASLDDPNDPPDLPPLEDLQAPLTAAVGHARVVAAGDMLLGGSNSNFGGNGDFFIDWAFERAPAEAAGFNTTQTARYYCGSANNGQTIAADCSGSANASCPLDSQFSDPITCGPSGCAICGNGTRTGGEGCDDGNLTDGDGCSSSCLIELGFPCTTSPACESGFCDPAGNICACDADGDCPTGDVCNTLPNPNQCVECISNAQCTDPTAPACDPLTNVCVECVLDDECPGDLVCDGTTNTCVQCVDDGDCPGGACNTSSNTCTGCVDDGDCPTGSVCETTLQLCVECLDDGDCNVDPAFPACKTNANPVLNDCVECVVNGDCVGDPDGLVCESNTNSCVECLNDTHCVGDPQGPVCDTSVKTCVPCLANGDCAAPTPACKTDATNSSNNLCVECTDSGDCGMGFVCNVATNECVQCTNDGQCLALDPTEPTCNLASSTCVVCLDDGDCSVNFPTTPNCKVDAGNADDNACVECIDDGDCTGGELCNTTNGTCVECLDDTACTGDEICNLSTNTCEPPCTNDDDCENGLVCDTATNTCVGCVDDADCESGVCDEDAQVCVECLVNADCPTAEPVCKQGDTNADNECVECVADSDCGSNECNTTTNTCEEPPATGCDADDDCQIGQVCDTISRDCIPGCRVDGTGNGCPEGQLCVEVAAGDAIGRCEAIPEEEEPGFDLRGGGCSCRAAGREDAGSNGGLAVALFGLALGGTMLRSRRRRRG
jgi:Cys-rich repeat protein